MSDVCGDNRFEIIEAYKKKLIEDTNIESRPDEMAVIDNILLRFWQMGWLPSAQPETCAYWDSESNICALHRPSPQPKLSKDDVETIRIGLQAELESLCNQGRWNEAKEQQGLLDRFKACFC